MEHDKQDTLRCEQHEAYDVKVSVIVLTYNHEKYIRRAIESVLMQRADFHYEILVGDDASTDATPHILQEYADKYPEKFRLFLRGKNLGASRNGYELAVNARGKYIANLDGDDFWTDKEKLMLQSNFLDSHPQYIGCSHKYAIVDEDGLPISSAPTVHWVSNKNKAVFTLKDFKGGILPGHPSTIMKRNIFINAKHDYSIIYKAHNMISDRTSALITLALGDYYIMDRSMGAYRHRLKYGGDNLTSILYLTDKNAILNDYIFTCKLQEYAEQILLVNGGFEKRKRELFVSAVFKAVINMDSKQMETAKKILKEAKHKSAYIVLFPLIFLKKTLIRCIDILKHRKMSNI